MMVAEHGDRCIPTDTNEPHSSARRGQVRATVHNPGLSKTRQRGGADCRQERQDSMKRKLQIIVGTNEEFVLGYDVTQNEAGHDRLSPLPLVPYTA
ncbi:hypothetical protein E2C01_022437 [Portunus trituberculatus]|uniref:Uncharacterized protein n=1 Tax=Portunus trituberculatus TaxID=210409 RepID=A0A5B7E796_PORTR|nr:hypothetical protein [Portunus trituberculatus]